MGTSLALVTCARTDGVAPIEVNRVQRPETASGRTIDASNGAAEQANKAAKAAVRHGKRDFIDKRAQQNAPPAEGDA